MTEVLTLTSEEIVGLVLIGYCLGIMTLLITVLMKR